MVYAKSVNINNYNEISIFLKDMLLSYKGQDIAKIGYQKETDLVKMIFFTKGTFINNQIKDELIRLNLYEHWVGTEVFIIKPGKTNAHTDSFSNWKYSLNIPVNTRETYVNFYSTNDEPINIDNHYSDYNDCNLTLEQTIRADIPFILNTMIPHDVENKSSSNALIFAFRLHNNLEINFT